MKTILITGTTGFLGTHFSKHYINQGYKVIGTGSKSEKDVAFNGVLEYRQLLLPDDELYDLIKKHNPDICIHCAGSSSVGFSVQNPQKDFDMNVPVTFHLLEGLRKFAPNCKILYPSSAAVYGNPKYLPIDEKHPLNPISPYGFHKMFCEKICYEYSNLYDLNVNIIRIFSAYGPGLQKQVLWDIYNKVKNEEQLTLSGTGQETRDFVYIEDILSASDIILNSSKSTYNVLNLASGKETTIQELAELMVCELGLDIEIKFNGTVREGDPVKWKADISKLNILGFETKFNIKDGIRKYCQAIDKCLK